jgi:hypothetical protein
MFAVYLLFASLGKEVEKWDERMATEEETGSALEVKGESREPPGADHKRTLADCI